jgi:hypothetical protein
MPTIKDILENSAVIQWLNDQGGRVRYGVPTSEKEAMAIRGEIPGHVPANDNTMLGQDIEQRRAAAYLFGKTWPWLGPNWQPYIDKFRSGEGDDPRVISVAQSASEQGSQEAESESAAARRALLQKYGSMLGLGRLASPAVTP